MFSARNLMDCSNAHSVRNRRLPIYSLWDLLRRGGFLHLPASQGQAGPWRGRQATSVDAVHFLRELVARGGPDPDEYAAVAAAFDGIIAAVDSGIYGDDAVEAIAASLGDAFTLDTTQGFVFRRPYGYAGDFEVIDRIYTRFRSPVPHLAKWDDFSHSRRSNRAVRNRKDYFIRMLAQCTTALTDGSSFRVLNVGSGPARDVKEFFDCYPDSRVVIDCLDQERRAVAYARTICADYLDRVSFVTANVFRYQPSHAYSLVWSAGLFDYLDDRAFQFLLKRLASYACPDGELVIGNFSPLNPDQNYMRFGGWHLNHRTAQDLMRILEASGIGYDQVTIDSEDEGINLFLRVHRPRTSEMRDEECSDGE